MHEREPQIRATPSAQSWAPRLARYREPNTVRTIFEIAITAGPFLAIWAFMFVAESAGYWEVLLLSIPAAGFLVRLFMIQHDCGHGSLFRSRSANDWVGRALGILTLTPYDFWRHSHAVHHATSGNLDHRGSGDIDTLTVREFLALPRWRRLSYRLYRHPVVMFGLGPAYLFILQHRLPVGLLRSRWQLWLSVMATNLAIAVFTVAAIRMVGRGPFLLIELPTIILAGSIGVWLFYVQHQFEYTHWSGEEKWNFHEAALHGSSHYDLPAVLRWFTANIGVHHIHHLSCRIPYYRLSCVMRDYPELAAVGRLTIRQSVRCVRMVLWDEPTQRLVSFRDVRALSATAASPKRSAPRLKRRRHYGPGDRSTQSLPDIAITSPRIPRV